MRARNCFRGDSEYSNQSTFPAGIARVSQLAGTMNADAPREVWQAAREEHAAADQSRAQR
jgi:hypothetical protein